MPIRGSRPAITPEQKEAARVRRAVEKLLRRRPLTTLKQAALPGVAGAAALSGLRLMEDAARARATESPVQGQLARELTETRLRAVWNVLTESIERLPTPAEVVRDSEVRTDSVKMRSGERRVPIGARHELAARVMAALRAVEQLNSSGASYRQKEALRHLCHALSRHYFEMWAAFPFWTSTSYVGEHPSVMERFSVPTQALIELSRDKGETPGFRRTAARMYLWTQLNLRVQDPMSGERSYAAARGVRRKRIAEMVRAPLTPMIADEALFRALGSQTSERMQLDAIGWGALRNLGPRLADMPSEHAVWSLLEEVLLTIRFADDPTFVPKGEKPPVATKQHLDEIKRFAQEVLPSPESLMQLGTGRAPDPRLALSFEQYLRVRGEDPRGVRWNFCVVPHGLGLLDLPSTVMSSHRDPFWERAAAVTAVDDGTLWEPPARLLDLLLKR